MKKLKILFITRDFSKNIEKSSFYLAQELAKQADLMHWHQDGPIESIVKQCPKRPDFVLLNDFKPTYTPFIRKLHRCPVPYGVIMHDLKYKMMQRKQYIRRENIQHIFSINKRPFLNYYPEFQNRLYWFPHHVPLHVFRDQRQPRTINWLMAGAMLPHLYPLRKKILQCMKDEKGFNYIKHPGYRNIGVHENQVATGGRYARLLNQSKMFLTCDSVEHFALLKYYEAAACGTLLLASGNKELLELGFRDKETMVLINENNIKAKAYEFLKDKAGREKLASQARKMVAERHSTERRVQELLQNIKQIIA